MTRFSHAVLTTIAAIRAVTGDQNADELGADDSGINLPLRKGGWINFRIIRDHFEVLFFDVTKKLMAACARGATVRFTDASNKARLYKLVIEGEKLVSRRVVSSPPTSQISLSLLTESLDGTRECFCFDYPAQH